MTKKKTILFFIGSLSSGGKERRLLELLSYLGKSKKFQLVLVTKKTEVLFDNFFELDLEWIQLKGNRISLKSIFEFFKIAKRTKPEIIHTWGSIQTLISIPFLLFYPKTKLVNSQITSAPPYLSISEKIVSKINFYFSDLILSNSFAGIEAYNPPKSKSKVIYNGLNFQRFENLMPPIEVKEKFELNSKYTLIMVASFSPNKDYRKFFEIGKALTKIRKDVTMIGLGFFKGGGEEIFEECVELTKEYPNIRPTPGSTHVESLINFCDIGVLFSNTKVHGEGISNALIEYMALGKPIIANDAGGTKEIVQDGYNGYLIQNESPEEIANMIDDLLNNPEKMKEMGRRSKERIYQEFSLDRMGQDFENVYEKLI
jgi:glycosyltransferase involved in cell wall biosynthesis